MDQGTSRDVEAAVTLAKSGNVSEPLEITLLAEAVALKYINPRAGLVLAVTACEVAAKRYLVKFAPFISCVIEETQLPELPKLVKRLIVARGTSAPVISKTLIKRLQEAVQTRNEIVHQGKEAKNIRESFDAAAELILSLQEEPVELWTRRRLQSAFITPESVVPGSAF